ncbi:unnamed protein product [Gordionus sp. m RMFG-2023]
MTKSDWNDSPPSAINKSYNNGRAVKSPSSPAPKFVNLNQENPPKNKNKNQKKTNGIIKQGGGRVKSKVVKKSGKNNVQEMPSQHFFADSNQFDPLYLDVADTLEHVQDPLTHNGQKNSANNIESLSVNTTLMDVNKDLPPECGNNNNDIIENAILSKQNDSDSLGNQDNYLSHVKDRDSESVRFGRNRVKVLMPSVSSLHSQIDRQVAIEKHYVNRSRSQSSDDGCTDVSTDRVDSHYVSEGGGVDYYFPEFDTSLTPEEHEPDFHAFFPRVAPAVRRLLPHLPPTQSFHHYKSDNHDSSVDPVVTRHSSEKEFSANEGSAYSIANTDWVKSLKPKSVVDYDYAYLQRLSAYYRGVHDPPPYQNESGEGAYPYLKAPHTRHRSPPLLATDNIDSKLEITLPLPMQQDTSCSAMIESNTPVLLNISDDTLKLIDGFCDKTIKMTLSPSSEEDPIWTKCQYRERASREAKQMDLIKYDIQQQALAEKLFPKYKPKHLLPNLPDGKNQSEGLEHQIIAKDEKTEKKRKEYDAELRVAHEESSSLLLTVEDSESIPDESTSIEEYNNLGGVYEDVYHKTPREKNFENDNAPVSKASNKPPKVKEATDIGTVLIEGVLFRAAYLGSTHIHLSQWSNKRHSRTLQAREAVTQVKALDGESQPSTEVDLFISTEKIMVLNTNLQEIMMDHPLKSICYIADIGDIVVVMVKKCLESKLPASADDKMICHVFQSDEANLIAQSLGQAFQIAYLEFLKSKGLLINGENKTSMPNEVANTFGSLFQSLDYQDVLNSQEVFGEELDLFSKRETQKEVVIPKSKGEILGLVIVESGWGSIIPTVTIANLMSGSPATRGKRLNVGDRIISVNGFSLVGLPLEACQARIKGCHKESIVRLKVIPCSPVVQVKIKRPDSKFQLGFSVQNGTICSLLRGGIAERGGIRVGHRIIEINGESVVAIPHDQIVKILSTSIGEIEMKTMPTSIFRLLTGIETPNFI